MRYLTTDEGFLIHERILDRFGGAAGIRDWNLLDSAVQRPQAAFGGQELYQDIFTKAAALGHSLVLNHPFVDGNKRTAWESMKRFLGENSYALRATSDEIVELMLHIEDKSLTIKQIAAWLKRHTRRQKSKKL